MSSSATGPATSKELFLSYHTVDGESVRKVREVLEARGISTFFAEIDLGAGLLWGPALEEALNTVRAVAIFVGPEELGPWQLREKAYAEIRQVEEKRKNHDFPVIPVLLPGAQSITDTFLSLYTWVDLRSDLTASHQIDRLIKAVRGESISQETTDQVVPCPYQGLNAFREMNAEFFFGRQKSSERLLEMVRTGKDLVVVLGASGSGKSSVVHAGLLPRLRLERPPEKIWDAVSFTPGNRPFHRLAAALVPLAEPRISPLDRVTATAKLAEQFTSGEVRIEDAAVTILKSNGTDRLLVIVDQFEELFTQTSRQDRVSFVQWMLAVPAGAPVQFVLTVRADYYAQLIDVSRDLSDRMERNVLNIGSMTSEELEAAVVEPAKKAGLEFEEGLAERLLGDVKQEPGHLPLLQFALTELFERRQGRLLTHKAYEDFGGVAQAISHRADAEFQRFNPAEQAIIQRIFSRLVRIAPPDEGGEDARQRASVSELGDEARPFINALTEARLLVTAGDRASDHQTVEISHEALIREWPRFRQWLNEDREFLLWRQRLRLSLEQWQHAKQDRQALLRGSLLTEAQRWQTSRKNDLSDSEQTFVAASIAFARKNYVQRFALVVGLFVLLSALAGFAWWQRQRAVAQGRVAMAANLASQARLVKDADPSRFDRAVLFAIESLKRDPGSGADAILREAIVQLPREISRFQLSCDVSTLTFAPAGKFLACMDAKSGGVKIVSTRDGKEPIVLPIPTYSEIVMAAVSPDARFVAVGFRKNGVKIYDVEMRTVVKSEGASSRATAIAFAPDGMAVAASVFNDNSKSADTFVFPLSGGTNSPSFPKFGRVDALAFSPEGSFLAVEHDSPGKIMMEVTIFDLATKRNWTIPGGMATAGFALTKGAESIALSRDRVVTLSAAKEDPNNRTEIGRLQHATITRAVALSGDGRYLASGSDDGTAKVMESATGEQVANVPVGSPVKAIAFTNEDNLVLLSADGIVRTLDIGRKAELQYVQSRSGQIVGISPGTQYFTTFNQKTGQDGNIALEFTINDRKTGNVLRTLQGTSDLQHDNNSIRYSADEQTLIAVSPDYGIKQRAVNSDQTLFQEPLAGNALAIAISGDGKTVAVANPESIDIIRSAGVKRRESLNVAKGIPIALAFDGNLIAVGSETAFVSVLDVDTKKEVARLSLDARLLMAAFSLDGRYLLTFAQNKSLALFPVSGGKALWRRDLDVSQMLFSHAGRLIAVVPTEQPVTAVLDIATGRNVATIQNARDSLPFSAAFGPDDSYIDVADDTSVARHYLQTDKLIQQTCALLTRNLTEAEWATVSTGTPYTPTCTKP